MKILMQCNIHHKKVTYKKYTHTLYYHIEKKWEKCVKYEKCQKNYEIQKMGKVFLLVFAFVVPQWNVQKKKKKRDKNEFLESCSAKNEKEILATICVP